MDYEPILALTTQFYREDYILNNPKSPKMILVYPQRQCFWDYTYLQIFLNEMHTFIPNSHPFSIVNDDKNQRKLYFHFRDSANLDNKINILISDSIYVYLSSNFLNEHFETEKKVFYSSIGAENKMMKTVKLQNHVRFFKKFNEISVGSQILLYKCSMVYSSKYDFSKIFHFFSKRIIPAGLPLNECTEMIYKYHETFSVVNSKRIQSIDDLKREEVKGYLKFVLKYKTCRRKLPNYFLNNNEYYIVGGVFILPYSNSLFQNGDFSIEGYILDTTWTIMDNFVTAILMACFSNTSLPIAFAFGNTENANLYRLLLNTVKDQINIEFTNKFLESDQGKALLVICDEFKMKHLCCIKHLLTNLKNKDYSFEIERLIKCESNLDLFNCTQIFSNKFSEICAQNNEEFININASLSKVGLVFLNNQICIQNPKRWNEVSLAVRCQARMPSTTNTLEATHGHLNKRTPRRNTFYQSIFRLYTSLMDKYMNVNKRIAHNYYYLKNKTVKMMKSFDDACMQNMIAFYQTSINECACSNNKLASSNYRIDIPCVHRLRIGSQFPELPECELQLNFQYNDIIMDFDFLQEAENYVGHYENDIEYAIKTIKFFSRYKDENKIRGYVSMHYSQEIDSFFINNQQISTIQLVQEGIFYFKKLKQNNNN